MGYLREAERGVLSEEFAYTHGRYRCWVSLGVTHWLVPGASLAGHVAGIAAGLLHIYVPQACECAALCCAALRSPAAARAPACSSPRPAAASLLARPGLLAAGWTGRTPAAAGGGSILAVSCSFRRCHAGLELWRRVTGRQPPMRLQAGTLQRHRTRWWRDLLGHLVVGAGTVAVVLMRRRALERAAIVVR